MTQVTLLISEPDNILMGIEIFNSGTNTSKCIGNKYKFTRSWQVMINLKNCVKITGVISTEHKETMLPLQFII